MTCIVGVEHDGEVTIGGDAMLSDPWLGASMATAKVWKRGEWVYGYCGSLRGGQILQYIFTAPQLPDEDDDEVIEHYLVNDWSESLRATFLDAGHVKIKHEVQSASNTWFLMGIRGRLYTMQGDFSVWRVTRGFQSIGSGEQIALGALEALKPNRKLTPEQRIRIAIEAAAEHVPSVGGPITVVTTADHEEAV